MANLYYCHSIDKGSGILRAVLSVEESGRLLNALSAEYSGPEFPSLTEDQPNDFATLCISEEELDGKWPCGFYCFNADITRIEEIFRFAMMHFGMEKVGSTEPNEVSV